MSLKDLNIVHSGALIEAAARLDDASRYTELSIEAQYECERYLNAQQLAMHNAACKLYSAYWALSKVELGETP